MDIEEFKIEFDDIFLKEIESCIEEAKNYTNESHINLSLEHIKNIASNGKRIRPYNAALAYTTYSQKNWQEIKYVLIGLECIHLMALVHDDIMDSAVNRHSVQTMHEFVKNNINNNLENSKILKVSDSQAILIGDLIFSWAYKFFSYGNLNKQSWEIINKLMEEVIVGQMLDVITPISKETTKDIVINKMLLKTARYTFTQPLQLGALCAGKEISEVSWLENFGDATGLMFQAQDDVLDIVGDAAILKKDAIGDIRNGIHTLISLYIQDNSNEENKAKWLNWFGNDSFYDQKMALDLIKETGALSYINEYIDDQSKKALHAISIASINEDKKENFRKIISMILNRKS